MSHIKSFMGGLQADQAVAWPFSDGTDTLPERKTLRVGRALHIKTWPFDDGMGAWPFDDGSC
jgi:hypothetical protein